MRPDHQVEVPRVEEAHEQDRVGVGGELTGSLGEDDGRHRDRRLDRAGGLAHHVVGDPGGPAEQDGRSSA